MEEKLKAYLLHEIGMNPEPYTFEYMEDINEKANTNEWLEDLSSYIYKVGVLIAKDWNKVDFARVVIGSQRTIHHEPVVKGYFYFNQGENDDMGRTIQRAVDLLQTDINFDLS